MAKILKIICGILVLFLVQNEVHTEAKNVYQIPKMLLNILKHKFNEVLEAVDNNDQQCAKDLKQLFNDLVHMKRWALEMVDASAKIPSGLLAGNIHLTGNFDQCLNINSIKNETNIQGQYCLVIVTPSLRNSLDQDMFSIENLKNFLGIKSSQYIDSVLNTIKMTYGICIPSTCSINNLQSIWNYIEKTFYTPIRVNFYDTMCSTKLKKVYPLPTDLYVGFAFMFYLGVILLSTWYDVCFHQYSDGDENDLLISFSIYSNIKKIWRVRDVQKEDAYLESICGIKVICMFWVCLGHRVVLNFLSGITNLMQTHIEWKYEIFTAFLISGSFAVDTFLALSGLLISFGILSLYYIYGYQKFPILPFYIYRLMRIWPALIALVLFYVTYYKNISEGPLWPLMASNLVRSCHKAWFPTMFFFNNYIPFGFQCVEQTWYLAVDSQLFLFSPILIIALLRNPLKTCIACIAISTLSAINTFYVTIKYNLGSSFMEFSRSYQGYIYMSTTARMPAWFIGFLFGYIIFQYRNAKIPKVAKIFTWTLVSTIYLGLILVHILFMNADKYNPVKSAVFNACARQLWSIAIGLTVLVCRMDREGLVNRFLSQPIFQRLVRVSYSVYVTHFAVIAYFVGSKKQSTYFKNISNVHDFAGDIFFIVIVASIWCILFESPFVAIAKFFYKKEIYVKTVAIKDKLQVSKKRNKKNFVFCLYEVDDQKLE